KKDNVVKPAKASQEKVDADREKSPRAEPPVKKVKEELPKTDSTKTSSSQKEDKALGTPRKAHPKVAKDHTESRPGKEEKAKKDHPKETKSEKPSNKEDKSKKAADKSKPSDAKPEKRKRKPDEKADKDHEGTSIKASKPETAESKASPKGKAEPDSEKGERTPEKDKSALNNPAKKIKLNRETGKKIVSGENVPGAKEPVEKPEPSSSKTKQEKAKGKARRKMTAADGSSSTLVDYTSTSSTGGSPVRKTEEKPEKTDTKRTVIKTMEEYNNDITAPAEDVIIMIQVPQSKWDKDDFESEEEDIKSTQVPTSIGKPASVIKNVSTKPPNPIKHSEKETEPLEKTLKTTKEVSYESSQHDAKSSKSSMLSEKGKTKDRDHSLSDKDASEKRKSNVQPEKDHLERATEQGNGKNASQSSKDSRSSEKHDPGRGSTTKDFTPNRDKKSDHDGGRDHSSSKRQDDKSELARRKDSPSRNRESTSTQKSKPREERAEPSKKGTGDGKRSSYSPSRERKQSDHKAAHDSKQKEKEKEEKEKENEKEKEKEREKLIPEVKSNTEKEPAGNKPPLIQESPDVKCEKENVAVQGDKGAAKPKAQVSSSSRLSSDLTRETDEAAFVPDYNESDSESNVSAKEEEAVGKAPKEPKEKPVEKAKEEPAAPAAAAEQPEGRSQSQSSPSVSRSRSQSPSESQTRSHSSSASSAESQDSKKK
ncbi:RBBP6 ligase, partial [Centropus unirufus]|nr:RBBP6 ligase [Centropus unirufus]